MGKVNSALAAALVALACAGCGGDDEPSAGETTPNIVQPGAPGQPSRTLTPEELEDIPETKYTAADVAFMQGMIHHHAQAIRMTNLVPARSRRQGVELLARRMDISQTDEITQIRRWLRARGEKAQPPHGAGGMRLPGMLSEPELKRLAAARGAAFDRLFLTSMIRHHQGALKMVADLYASGGGAEPELGVVVRHVDSDQQVEISRMQTELAQLPD